MNIRWILTLATLAASAVLSNALLGWREIDITHSLEIASRPGRPQTLELTWSYIDDMASNEHVAIDVDQQAQRIDVRVQVAHWPLQRGAAHHLSAHLGSNLFDGEWTVYTPNRFGLLVAVAKVAVMPEGQPAKVTYL